MRKKEHFALSAQKSRGNYESWYLIPRIANRSSQARPISDSGRVTGYSSLTRFLGLWRDRPWFATFEGAS